MSEIVDGVCCIFLFSFCCFSSQSAGRLSAIFSASLTVLSAVSPVHSESCFVSAGTKAYSWLPVFISQIREASALYLQGSLPQDMPLITCMCLTDDRRLHCVFWDHGTKAHSWLPVFISQVQKATALCLELTACVYLTNTIGSCTVSSGINRQLHCVFRNHWHLSTQLIAMFISQIREAAAAGGRGLPAAAAPPVQWGARREGSPGQQRLPPATRAGRSAPSAGGLPPPGPVSHEGTVWEGPRGAGTPACCESSSVQDGIYALRKAHMYSPCLSDISPSLPSKRCQCLSDWQWPSLSLSGKIIWHFLFQLNVFAQTAASHSLPNTAARHERFVCVLCRQRCRIIHNSHTYNPPTLRNAFVDIQLQLHIYRATPSVLLGRTTTTTRREESCLCVMQTETPE